MLFIWRVLGRSRCSRNVCLCAGEIIRPIYALHRAANPSGRDVFELLYDVSHVASALALQDNTQLLTFLKNNSKWPGLQKVVRKVPKVGSKGIASLLIDASGISFLVEHLLVSHKETH